jgi:hypothetical protein
MTSVPNNALRLLRIEGDLVAVYEGRRRLAIFAGARQLDRESAETLRLTPEATILAQPIEPVENPTAA